MFSIYFSVKSFVCPQRSCIRVTKNSMKKKIDDDFPYDRIPSSDVTQAFSHSQKLKESKHAHSSVSIQLPCIFTHYKYQ